MHKSSTKSMSDSYLIEQVINHPFLFLGFNFSPNIKKENLLCTLLVLIIHTFKYAANATLTKFITKINIFTSADNVRKFKTFPH